jgi:asparagine synthase (glutamine-hydrolysing)
MDNRFPVLGWLIAEERGEQYRIPEKVAEYSSRIRNYLIIYHPFNKFEHDHFLCETPDFLIGTDGVLLDSSQLLGEKPAAALPEVLIALGRENALKLPASLKGPYCGFFCDLGKKTAMIFTNAVGDRPVYYANLPDQHIASSDLNMLADFLKENGWVLTIDKRAAFSILQYGFLTDTYTMVSEIKRVFPGSCLIWDDNGEHEPDTTF